MTVHVGTLGAVFDRIRAKVVARFLATVEPVTESGCWIWHGKSGTGGYGQVHIYGARASTQAHRLSYELFVGCIQHGLQIHHKCGVRLCVNPEHLQAMTGKENNLLSNSMSANNARKTQCNSGHELSGSNVYSYKGKRLCRACRTAVDMQRRPTRTTAESRKRRMPA